MASLIKHSLFLKRILLLLPLIFLLSCGNSFGLGKKNPPKEPPTPIETPLPPVEPDNPPTPPDTDLTYWDELSVFAALNIDGYFSRYKELSKERRWDHTRTDQCTQELTSREPLFTYSIGYYIHQLMNKQILKMDGIGSGYYDVPSQSPKEAISLTSHPMCIHTQSTLETTLKKSTPERLVQKINLFATKYNQLYSQKKQGSKEAEEELFSFWFKLMGCLAYTESLTTADQARSYEIADKYAPSDYEKPQGVKFYYDASQSNPDSKLNIGLYQFSPKASGNISPCIEAWNDINPSCEIPKSESKENLIKILGSPLQNFNSFCGTHKILQTFHVQVNTKGSNHTAPQNRMPSSSPSSLKAPSDRCVTLHVYSGYSYNHFGPFQNSTGSNLESLLDCAMRE